MSNFVKVLQEKIDELEEQKTAIDDKIELLRELMGGETGKTGAAPRAPAKRKPGRPKGSTKKKAPAVGKHAVDDDLYQESLRSLPEDGTSPELQERMMKRKFKPQPRPTHSLGPGITAGTKQQVDNARGGSPKSNASLSVDEADLGDD